MPQALLDQTIEQYYGSLARRERQALAPLNKVYQEAERALGQELKRLEAELARVPESQWRQWETARLNRLILEARAQSGRVGQALASSLGQTLPSVASDASTLTVEAGRLGYNPGYNPNVPSFATLPEQSLEGIAATMSNGSPVSNLVTTFPQGTSLDFRNIMTKSVALGRNPRDTAREMVQAFGLTKSRANTIARTEIMRVHRESARKTMLENADVVKEWEWYCARDSRTCPMCWAMHGKKFPLKTPMGSHPNCRCTMLPVTMTFAELGLAGVPEPDFGPTFRPGAELFKELPESDKIQILGKAGYRAYKDGAVTLDSFVGTTQHPIWGTTRHAKSLRGILGPVKARKYLGSGVAPKPPAPPRLRVVPPAKALPPPVPKFQTPGEFTSHDEFYKWAKATNPHIEFDVDDMDLEALNDVMRQYDKMAKDWPEVNQKLEYMGTYGKNQRGRGMGRGQDAIWQANPNAMAWATNSGKEIAFNPEYYRSVPGGKPKVYDALKNAKQTQFLVSDHPASIMTHEWGHQVHNYMLRGGDKSFLAVVTSDGTGNLQSMTSEFLRSKRALNPLKDARGLSRYSAQDDYESFAEAFSNYYHNGGTGQDPYLFGFNNLLTDTKAGAFRTKQIPHFQVFDADSLGPDEWGYGTFAERKDIAAARIKAKALRKRYGLRTDDYDDLP